MPSRTGGSLDFPGVDFCKKLGNLFKALRHSALSSLRHAQMYDPRWPSYITCRLCQTAGYLQIAYSLKVFATPDRHGSFVKQPRCGCRQFLHPSLSLGEINKSHEEVTQVNLDSQSCGGGGGEGFCSHQPHISNQVTKMSTVVAVLLQCDLFEKVK